MTSSLTCHVKVKKKKGELCFGANGAQKLIKDPLNTYN